MLSALTLLGRRIISPNALTFRTGLSLQNYLLTGNSIFRLSTAPAVPKAAVNQDQLRISDRCVERLREVSEKRGRDVALRIRVDGGGCSGFQYAFELVDADNTTQNDTKKVEESVPSQHQENKAVAEIQEEDEEENEIVIEKDGFKVLVDDISMAFIKGAEIDYEVEMIRSSFRVVDNPNSESSCGCGVSFTAKA